MTTENSTSEKISFEVLGERIRRINKWRDGWRITAIELKGIPQSRKIYSFLLKLSRGKNINLSVLPIIGKDVIYYATGHNNLEIYAFYEKTRPIGGLLPMEPTLPGMRLLFFILNAFNA